MNNQDTQLSRSLSWLLRHGAKREGFHVSPEGYIEVDKILQHRNFKGKYNNIDIVRVVDNNDKKRFKLRSNPESGVLEIKAHQGHTLTEVTDVELTPIVEPIYKTIVHGTYLRYWPQIKKEGLCRMKRQHIHLAKGTLEDTNIISGIRKDTEIYIYIDIEKALRDGIKLFESENGVVLTSGNEKGYLEPKYFLKVIKVKTGDQLYP